MEDKNTEKTLIKPRNSSGQTVCANTATNGTPPGYISSSVHEEGEIEDEGRNFHQNMLILSLEDNLGSE